MNPHEKLTILHLTDLHITAASKFEVTKRIEALLHDLQEKRLAPDLVFFTGDIANAGLAEEFALAEKDFFIPLMTALKLQRSRLFIVPGNHDVDRTKIDPALESQFRSTVQTVEQAEKYLSDPEHAVRRLESYYDYAKEHHGWGELEWHSSRLTVSGLNLHISCLNTAWRCANDDDKDHLFLTVQQVHAANQSMDDTALNIALLHHPFDWLHLSDRTTTVPLVQHTFDLIISGHVHTPETTNTVTANSSFVTLTAAALMEGYRPAGYSVYEIDYPKRSLKAHYRKFIKQRYEYDSDTDSAKNGEALFDLPIKNSSIFTSTTLAVKASSLASRLDSRLEASLKWLQETDTPILVRPAVRQVVWQDRRKVYGSQISSLVPHLMRMNFLSGPAESGKSVLLQLTAQEISRSVNPLDTICIFVDVREVGKTHALSHVQNQIKLQEEDSHKQGKMLLFVDHIDGLPEDQLAGLVELVRSEANLSLIVTTSNDLVFQTFMSADSLDTAFFEMFYWGPSRIKELVARRFERTSIDLAAAYKFIVTTLKNSDLPATPVMIMLYMAMFPKLQGEVSSLSFLRLLQRYEELKFGTHEQSAADSLYNKRRLLALIAAEMVSSGSDLVSTRRTREIFDNYFKTPGLPYNFDSTLKSMVQSGMIRVGDFGLCFSCYVFMDYYMAQALELNLVDRSAYFNNLEDILYISDSLALYSGLKRDDSSLANEVLASIESRFSAKDLTLKDLETYIKDLLVPAIEPYRSDEELDGAKKQEVDLHEEDESFEITRAGYRKSRSRELRVVKQLGRIESVGVLVKSLSSFYRIFRNLENIDMERKVSLLDKILSYHITCNMELIDVFSQLLESGDQPQFGLFEGEKERRFRDMISTMAAYMATMAGIGFLYSFVGSQSLRLTLEKAWQESKNDFKRLLIVFLMADLRISNFDTKMSELLLETKSLAAVEMIYLKMRSILVETESSKVTPGMEETFKGAISKRLNLSGGKVTPGVMAKIVQEAKMGIKRDRMVEMQRKQSWDQL